MEYFFSFNVQAAVKYSHRWVLIGYFSFSMALWSILGPYPSCFRSLDKNELLRDTLTPNPKTRRVSVLHGKFYQQIG
jgi:hypothetical protein